ncbi:MAG: hypothetical protein LAO09_05655 [Acidobacteriia bacterium]|nr:hypothetical protein [Terriglobia bacterium]
MNKLTISIMIAFGMASSCLQGLSADVRDVLGTWEGESICTVRPSPCHDVAIS